MTRPFGQGRTSGPVRARGYRPGVEGVEARQLLATLLVTTAADAGAGSLRQAILDANVSTTASVIDFRIGTGAQTIIPASPLPVITNPVTIDGTTQPGYAGTPLIQINGSQIFEPNTTPPNAYRIPYVAGLVVSGGNSTIRGLDINRFTGPGIFLSGGGHDLIAGNYIGTDLSGTNALGNGADGLYIGGSRFNVIGGTTAADRNVISGNSADGIDINSGGYTSQLNAGNLVEGNVIGADVTGTNDLGNGGDGVAIVNSGNNVVGGYAPGTANLIAYNGGNGVDVVSYGYYNTLPIGTQISSNSIFANSNQGIALGSGAANPVINPRLTAAYLSGAGTAVEGAFVGVPGASYTVQFFDTPSVQAPYGPQGKTLIAQQVLTADSTGLVRFSTVLATAVPVGDSVSATATDATGNSSAFFGGARVATGPSADLGVAVAAGAASVIQGTGLVYTIGVVNSGPATATGVVVTDALPAGTIVTSVKAPGGTVAQANGRITITYDHLYPGDLDTIEVNVIATGLGTVTNGVAAYANQPDPNPANNTATVDTQLTLNVVAPQILAERLAVGLRSINQITLVFSAALDPLQATNPINYSLKTLGRGHKFNVNVPFTIAYDAKAQSVTIHPRHPLMLGQIYQLTLDGQGSAGITDLSGNLLAGNTPAGPLGPWVDQISRGVVLDASRYPAAAGAAFSRTIDTVISRHVQTTSNR